jgi:hypothetical protein
LKIKLTKEGGFFVTNFREFLGFKGKGRAPIASEAATGKKCKKWWINPRDPKILMMTRKMKKVKKNQWRKNHLIKHTKGWDDVDMQEYKGYHSSKNCKALLVKTRVVRSSNGESKKIMWQPVTKSSILLSPTLKRTTRKLIMKKIDWMSPLAQLSISFVVYIRPGPGRDQRDALPLPPGLY